jgi:hypothetical protein
METTIRERTLVLLTRRDREHLSLKARAIPQRSFQGAPCFVEVAPLCDPDLTGFLRRPANVLAAAR